MKKHIHMKIDGMHCEHCAKGVQDALHKLPQVKSAQVHLPEKSAIVEWDGEEVYEPTLRGAVSDAGFAVVSFND